MMNEQVTHIEFKQILKAIKRRFYIIVLLTVPALLLALYYNVNTETVPPLYIANTTVIFRNSSTNESNHYQIDEILGLEKIMNVYKSLALTFTVAEETRGRMKLSDSANKLQSCIQIIPQPNTPYMELILTWPDQNDAEKILDVYTQVFIKEAEKMYPDGYKIKVFKKAAIMQVIATAKSYKLYTIFGIAGAFITSLLVIFAIEFIDDTLKTDKDVQELLDIPVISVIPKVRKKIREISQSTIRKLDYSVIEGFRSLRTGIYFSAIDVRTIVVTSFKPREGKTTAAALLAAAIARDGLKTILVDCDMRKPDVCKLFRSDEEGLSNILTEDAAWKSMVQKSDIDNLYILAAGSKSLYSSEILSMKKMDQLIKALKTEFQYIILDTPAIGVVTDAQVLSKYADGYLLVVSSGKTTKDEAVKAKRLIHYATGKILGVLLNNVKDPAIHSHHKYYRKRSAKTGEKEAYLANKSYMYSHSIVNKGTDAVTKVSEKPAIIGSDPKITLPKKY